uniref:phospholipase A2 n=1 Tax=Naja naja TaxID=35670 RepID=A0A8C6X3I7_NAJNA
MAPTLLLALLLALLALLGTGHPLGKAPSRPRRGILQLAGMIQCTTGRTPLAYIRYGCYCGLGGFGWPKDQVDWVQRGLHAGLPQRLHRELCSLPARPANQLAGAEPLQLGEDQRPLPGHHPVLCHRGERQQAGAPRQGRCPPQLPPFRDWRPRFSGAAGGGRLGRQVAPRLHHLVLPPGALLVLPGPKAGLPGLQLSEGLRDSAPRVAPPWPGARHAWRGV